MEGGMVFQDSQNIPAFLHSERLTSSSQDFDSLWASNSPHHGQKPNSTSMKPFFAPLEGEEHDEDDHERFHHQPEKKRRLTVDQVRFLERCFEEENKLEPERKMELAKELNLQPRQVAIWFQNRRARFKTKQLETDYEVLKSSYDNLKLDFDGLHKENEKLKLEVQMLVEKLLERERGKKDSNPFEIPMRELESHAQKPNPFSQNWSSVVNAVICKQEHANSVSGKSDVIDSESPYYTDGNHSSFLEPAEDSSNVFENQSEDEEDNFSKNILRCPKIEYESFIEGYPLPVEDQPFWLWP